MASRARIVADAKILVTAVLLGNNTDYSQIFLTNAARITDKKSVMSSVQHLLSSVNRFEGICEYCVGLELKDN